MKPVSHRIRYEVTLFWKVKVILVVEVRLYDLLKCNAVLHTRSERYSALNLVYPRYNRESEGRRKFSVSATRLCYFVPINLKKGTFVTQCSPKILAQQVRDHSWPVRQKICHRGVLS